MKKYRLLFMLLIALMISGCGGGSGSSGITALVPGVNNNQSGGSSATITKTENQTGWSLLRLGSTNYTAAKASFNSVLTSSSSTNSEKAVAEAGLGWISMKENGAASVDPSTSDLNKALTYDSTNKEALIGISILYLTRAGNEEVGYLESIGLGDVNYEFTSDYLNISNAEAHSLMALAYYNNGQLTNAKNQINKSKELDGNDVTIEQISTSLNSLGF